MEHNEYSKDDGLLMNVTQKLDFIRRVHIGELDIWDEDGNESFIWDDFHTVSDELRRHPEWFELENLTQTMKMPDERCFELSWQEQLSEMIYAAVMYHGNAGMTHYLQHLQDVPKEGRFHGCHIPIQWFIRNDESYDMLKEVLLKQNEQTKQIFLEILESIKPFSSRKKEEKVRYRKRKEALQEICC